MMSKALSSSAQKVQDALTREGFGHQVIELADTTRTAQDAATAVGCQVGQIVKSLVFKGKQTRTPVLVVASGANRVNEKNLGEVLSEPVKMAHPDFVKEKTGFVIGGVPPVGHSNPLKTFIDEDLLQYQDIWAAAGNPNAMFRLTPDELQKMTRGQVISVK